MNEFETNLAQINRLLKKELLTPISKQQVRRMMNKTPIRCKDPLLKDEHYQEHKKGKYTGYLFSDDGVKFLREWAIELRSKKRRWRLKKIT